MRTRENLSFCFVSHDEPEALARARSHLARKRWAEMRHARLSRINSEIEQRRLLKLLPLSFNRNDRDQSSFCPSPRAYCGNSDPFQAAAIQLGPDAHQALSLAYVWSLSWNYPPWATLIFEEDIKKAKIASIRHSISDATSLNCLLAAGYCVKSVFDQSAIEKARTHKLNLITELRSRLLASQLPLRLIDQLIPLAMFFGDFEAAAMHWKAMQHILTIASPKEVRHFSPRLWVLDVWLAYFLDRSPLLDISSWDPLSPMPRLSDTIPEFSGTTTVVDRELQLLIVDRRGTLEMREQVAKSLYSSQLGARIQEICVHEIAIDGRLQQYCRQHMPFREPMDKSEAIHMATVLSLMSFIHVTQVGVPYGISQAKKFQNLEQLVAIATAGSNGHLAFWLLFMSAVNDALLPKPTGIPEQIFALARETHADWKETRWVLSQTLYCDGIERFLKINIPQISVTESLVHQVFKKLWLAEQSNK